jgi:CheY-like chemotaxis protein
MATVMIVEDDRTLLGMLEFALTDEGYAVEMATNGSECLSMLNGHFPDLILADINMPEIDGAELCRRLSLHPKYTSIPIVMMSAGINQAKLGGCRYTGFLKKPFLLTELYDTIQAALSSP